MSVNAHACAFTSWQARRIKSGASAQVFKLDLSFSYWFLGVHIYVCIAAQMVIMITAGGRGLQVVPMNKAADRQVKQLPILLW